MKWKYEDKAREVDHICYISNLGHLKRSLPGWDLTRSLDQILQEVVVGWRKRTQ